MIRGRGGHRDNPNTVQFEQAYRAVATGMIMKDFSAGRNSEQDLDFFFLQANHIQAALPTELATNVASQVNQIF